MTLPLLPPAVAGVYRRILRNENLVPEAFSGAASPHPLVHSVTSALCSERHLKAFYSQTGEGGHRGDFPDGMLLAGFFKDGLIHPNHIKANRT